MSRPFPSPHLAIVAAALTGGCVTTGVVQTAETVGKDTFQFAFEPGAIGAADAGGAAALPSFNISARYGVTDKVDIGGRFGTTLLEGSVKVMLTDYDPDALVVSVAPHIGGIGLGSQGSSAGILWVRVPFLLDVPVGSHDLVFGPGARMITFFGSTEGESGAATVLTIGSSVGFAARVGTSARLMPEIGIDYPIVGSASDGGGTFGLGADGVLFSVQLGILLGGRSLPKE